MSLFHCLLVSSKGESRLHGDGSTQASSGQIVADFLLCETERASFFFTSLNIRGLVLISGTKTATKGSVIIVVVGKYTAMVLQILVQMGVFSISIPITESGLFPCMHYH